MDIGYFLKLMAEKNASTCSDFRRAGEHHQGEVNPIPRQPRRCRAGMAKKIAHSR